MSCDSGASRHQAYPAVQPRDYQDLATDITASTVKSGENAASVKTFLVNKLMPGALDFFTVHSPEGSPSQPSNSKTTPRVCHTMDVRCKHRKVWILPIKDDMRYQSTIFTLYTKGHLG